MDAMREGEGGDRGDDVQKPKSARAVLSEYYSPNANRHRHWQWAGEYEQEEWDMWELCTGSAHSFEHGHVRIIIFKTRQRNPLFCPLSINPT